MHMKKLGCLLWKIDIGIVNYHLIQDNSVWGNTFSALKDRGAQLHQINRDSQQVDAESIDWVLQASWIAPSRDCQRLDHKGLLRLQRQLIFFLLGMLDASSTTQSNPFRTTGKLGQLTLHEAQRPLLQWLGPTGKLPFLWPCETAPMTEAHKTWS